MFEYSQVKEIITSYDNVTESYPYGEEIEVYSLNEQMFALLYKDIMPLQLSLRCDRLLSKHLREKYETVLSGRDLNPKSWITVILTGQLTLEEVRDLIRHSYELTKELDSN
jgi:predicted DNA-binding protein (MmcQ/YjbR family)